MKEGVYFVTGGTSGVGLSVIRGIANYGGRVFFAGHNRDRGLRVQNELRESTGNDRIEFLEADLADMEDLHRLAEEVEHKTDRLHVLSYNAGIFSTKYSVNPQGIERTFAVNYLGFYALSVLLAPLLAASAPSRIISVSGGPGILRRIKLDLDRTRSESGYNGVIAAVQSALAKVYCAFELAAALKETGVTANTYHPGLVRSGLGDHMPAPLRPFFNIANLFMSKTSQTGIYAATAQEVEDVTGAFLAGSRVVPFENKKTTPEDVKKLIALSAEQTGVPWKWKH